MSKDNKQKKTDEKQWTKYVTQNNNYLEYKEFKEKTLRDIVENAVISNDIKVCRDNQFDAGDKTVIAFLLKSFVIGLIPIIVAIYFNYLISKSVDFKIQAGTWQAYMSLILVLAASFGMFFGIKVYAKKNNVGNKFLYYVISDKGLYFTHLGNDEIGRLIRAHMKLVDKIATVPLWIYVLMYMMYGNGYSRAIWLARVETSFKINQKYQIAEKLLNSTSFASYSNKIVAVTKIKEYSYGCEVTWKYLRAGVEGEESHIIYKNTSNYEQLIDEFRKRLTNENIGDTLNSAEKRQVYGNVIRQTATLLLGAVIIIIVAISSYGMYLKNAELADSLYDGMLKAARTALAYRARRRTYRGIYSIVILVIIPIIKMIVDIFTIRKFTVVSVKKCSYYKPKRKIYKEILSEFHYFASVEWKGEKVTVGLSGGMWKQKDSVEPMLVLRKGVPYCLIYRKNLSER